MRERARSGGGSSRPISNGDPRHSCCGIIVITVSDNGIIWHRMSTQSPLLQLLVPKPGRKELFLSYHDSLFGGNLGQLSANASKTKFMLITRQQAIEHEPLHLMFNNEKLERVSHTKFFGLYIDEYLQWNRHISHRTQKISSGLLSTSCLKVPKNGML